MGFIGVWDECPRLARLGVEMIDGVDVFTEDHVWFDGKASHGSSRTRTQSILLESDRYHRSVSGTFQTATSGCPEWEFGELRKEVP